MRIAERALPRVRRDHVAALLAAFRHPEEIERVLGPLPEFPARGADLIAAGIEPGPGLSAAMSRLRAVWRASGYRTDQATLLDVLADPVRASTP